MNSWTIGPLVNCSMGKLVNISIVQSVNWYIVKLINWSINKLLNQFLLYFRRQRHHRAWSWQVLGVYITVGWLTVVLPNFWTVQIQLTTLSLQFIQLKRWGQRCEDCDKYTMAKMGLCQKKKGYQIIKLGQRSPLAFDGSKFKNKPN